MKKYVYALAVMLLSLNSCNNKSEEKSIVERSYIGQEDDEEYDDLMGDSLERYISCEDIDVLATVRGIAANTISYLPSEHPNYKEPTPFSLLLYGVVGDYIDNHYPSFKGEKEVRVEGNILPLPLSLVLIEGYQKNISSFSSIGVDTKYDVLLNDEVLKGKVRKFINEGIKITRIKTEYIDEYQKSCKCKAFVNFDEALIDGLWVEYEAYIDSQEELNMEKIHFDTNWLESNQRFAINFFFAGISGELKKYIEREWRD